jgi:hypothetical protein
MRRHRPSRCFRTKIPSTPAISSATAFPFPAEAMPSRDQAGRSSKPAPNTSSNLRPSPFGRFGGPEPTRPAPPGGLSSLRHDRALPFSPGSFSPSARAAIKYFAPWFCPAPARPAGHGFQTARGAVKPRRFGSLSGRSGRSLQNLPRSAERVLIWRRRDSKVLNSLCLPSRPGRPYQVSVPPAWRARCS